MPSQSAAQSATATSQPLLAGVVVLESPGMDAAACELVSDMLHPECNLLRGASHNVNSELVSWHLVMALS